MNRRYFLGSSVAMSALLPIMRASALDVDVAESPIMWLLRMLPDRPGPDGFDFPYTSGANHMIQRLVWPENPDRYWDPEGEDYHSIFGFYPNALNVGTNQGDMTVWSMNMEYYTRDASLEKLESHGWMLVDENLTILRYTGDDEERSNLAATLNVYGNQLSSGGWDWIALPDEPTIVIGPDADNVRAVAERVKNYPAMTTVDIRFNALRYLLLPEAYVFHLVPPQLRSVKNTTSMFLSKSWMGDVPIIQSIGLELESPDHVEPMIATIRDRLQSETSVSVGTTFGTFLEIVDITDRHASIRIDFVAPAGEWDIVTAFLENDLGFLPTA